MGKVSTACSQGGSRSNASSSSFHLDNLRSEADRLLTASIAPKTKLAYGSGLKAFNDFRDSYNKAHTWPPNTQDIVDFLACLSLKGSAPSTARSYLSAIGYHCKMLQVADSTQTFVVKKVLLGMSRLGSQKDKRLPITKELLHRIIMVLSTVCFNQYEASLFQAAFTLAFFGFLRIGELVFDSPTQCGHTLAFHNVQVQDQDNVLEIFLPHSKTDQSGKGTMIVLSAVRSPLCPVNALRVFLLKRPKLQGPLFVHYNGIPVTRYQFSAVLKKALACIGAPPNSYSTHSFRIGAATAAASKGISEDGIKEFGRWESKAYKSYVRIPSSDLL